MTLRLFEELFFGEFSTVDLLLTVPSSKVFLKMAVLPWEWILPSLKQFEMDFKCAATMVFDKCMIFRS